MQRPMTSLSAPAYIVGDPIKKIITSAEFQTAREYFSDYPATSFLYNGGISRAFIYLLIRSMDIKNVLEIGTYQLSPLITRRPGSNGAFH